MIREIYQKAMSVLMKKPLRLWGISLLSMLLVYLAGIGFVGVPAVAFAVELLLGASMAFIYLKAYRTGFEPACADLFTAFKKERIWRVLGGMAWKELWIFIWALIPIVGPIFAIIRAYEYRFTPYILMEREDVKATDAIKISKQETMGFKGKMFGADILVFVLYFVIFAVLSLLGQIPYLGVLFKLVLILFVIAFAALVGLFLGIVQAAFYVETKNRPAPQQPTAYSPYPPYAPNGQQPNGYQPYPQQPAAPAPYPPQQPGNYAPQQPAAPFAQAAPQPSEPYAAPIAPQQPAAPGAPATVRCPSCGTELPAEAKFCPSCGGRMG